MQDSREILDYLECWANGRWFETPMSMDGLAKTTRASVYLQSGLNFKRNMLARTFVPHRLLSRQAFEQFALDWLWCGNCYLEKRNNMLRNTMGLLPPLAKYMRRGVDMEIYYQVRGWKDEHEFAPSSICHCARPISTRRSTACRSGWQRCKVRCSTRAPRCSDASTTTTAVTPVSSCT